MIDLTPIINVAITILAGIALRYLVPWLREKTTAKQREDMLVWVDIAVQAAQQLYYQADGKARLDHAMYVLNEAGFDINDTTLRNAVEAAVLKLHQGLVKSDDC